MKITTIGEAFWLIFLFLFFLFFIIILVMLNNIFAKLKKNGYKKLDPKEELLQYLNNKYKKA